MATLDDIEKVNFRSFGINTLFSVEPYFNLFFVPSCRCSMLEPSYTCVSLRSTRNVSYSQRV
ncbi:hypothetical protein ACSBR2_026721 [Camellia fascicularis]